MYNPYVMFACLSSLLLKLYFVPLNLPPKYFLQIYMRLTLDL